MNKITKLKGGSLNSTCLHQTDNKIFVRKSIRTDADREYGYVRWYSQLKKLQRYNEMFPGLFPEIYDVNTTEYGTYFDIEYIDAVDIKTLFKKDILSTEQVKDLHLALWESFDTIHSHTYQYNKNSLNLYFKEEVEQKLFDARKFTEFDTFFNIDHYDFCGEKIDGIKNIYERFQKLFDIQIDEECYVHGNPTLENILYNKEDKKIVFIDLYEEGIVDSKYMDYSQVLQCSNSLYGLINDKDKTIEGNYLNIEITIPNNLSDFDNLFNQELLNRYNNKKYFLIKLFEATQFFRMLPFKCHGGDFAGAKFFYVHACKLIRKLL